MAELPPSDVQREADAQAHDFVRWIQAHCAALQAAAASRAGACPFGGWDLTSESLDADLGLDAGLLRLAGGSASAAPGTLPPLGTDPFTAQQRAFDREFDRGSDSAPLAFAAGSTVGFDDGVRAILQGRAGRVALARGVALYNAADPRQLPRVRLRVQGLPVAVVRDAVPATGGPATQWYVAPGGSAASRRVRAVSPQRLRNVSLLAAERRMPVLLRWAARPVGGGVLARASGWVLDAWNAIGADLRSGHRSFDTDAFLLAQARWAGAGFTVTGAAAVRGSDAPAVSPPLLLLALGPGVVAQVVWHWSGVADAAEAQPAFH